jgi:ribosomal protein S18 acetylase RimI-like enzyme
MPLRFRLAQPSEYSLLEELVIDSFEPITWIKKIDQRFGPLNGLDWRERWKLRMADALESQTVLVGESDGQIVAYASGTYDPRTRLGFIDLLAVDRRFQGRGYGREILRGMLGHLRELGATHVNLECLADNDVANNLYRSEGFEEVARSIRWWMRLE